MDADIDVFPDTVLHDWQDWELLNFPYEEEIRHSMPFISYLTADNTGLFFPRGYNRIRYRMVPSTQATRTNHQYTLNNLSERAEDTSWFEVDRRIRKDPNRSKSSAAPEEEEERRHRHHPYHHSRRRRPVQQHGKMNVTLAFRHRNVFTTKKMFTFGIRNVAVDTCHVYQTKAYPLLVYLPKPHVYLNNQNRTFSCTTYKSYIPHLIPPNSVIKIQHPTFYVLLTAGKVLFAVDVVHVHTIPEIETAYGLVIQDELRPLAPPKPKPQRPPPSFVEGPSVMPLPVEWDRRSGQMRKRMAPPPPPPKFVNLARQAPPTTSIEPPPPPAATPIEPKPGPSWELTEAEKKESITIITLSDDEDDKIFIPRPEDMVPHPPKVPPEDIVSKSDMDALLESFIQNLGAYEANRILDHPESVFESSIVEQAMNAAGVDPAEEDLVSSSTPPEASETVQQHVINDFKLPDFQDLHDFLYED